MSWAAHELETVFFQKHLGQRISYLGVVLGVFLPDLVLNKLPAYGFDLGTIHLHVENGARWHRGWPGLGFTHSLMAALIFAIIFYLITKRNKAWFFGVFIGAASHCITDICDTAGTMLFWPFYNDNIFIGIWKYGFLEGKHGDAIAYYGSLGFVMDFAWLSIVAIFAWRVLSNEFFYNVVWPADPAWDWFKYRLHIPDRVLLALYRSFFFYGACRTISWTIWVHAVVGHPWDLSWGGPYWVAPFEPW